MDLTVGSIPLVKLCPACGECKDASNFFRSNRTPDGLYTYCRPCKAAKAKAEYENPEKRARIRATFNEWRVRTGYDAKREAKDRHERWAKYLVDCAKTSAKHRPKLEQRIVTITEDDILEMFEAQRGLCHWFHVPMIPSAAKRDPQRPSLDRIDNDLGYTRENVVLSCYAANMARSASTQARFHEFVALLATTLRPA